MSQLVRRSFATITVRTSSSTPCCSRSLRSSWSGRDGVRYCHQHVVHNSLGAPTNWRRKLALAGELRPWFEAVSRGHLAIGHLLFRVHERVEIALVDAHVAQGRPGLVPACASSCVYSFGGQFRPRIASWVAAFRSASPPRGPGGPRRWRRSVH